MGDAIASFNFRKIQMENVFQLFATIPARPAFQINIIVVFNALSQGN